MPRLGSFTPGGRDPVLIVQKDGWASGPVWMGPEYLAPTGVLTPDRPSRSEKLYQLRYPGLSPFCLTPIINLRNLFQIENLTLINIPVKFLYIK